MKVSCDGAAGAVVAAGTMAIRQLLFTHLIDAPTRCSSKYSVPRSRTPTATCVTAPMPMPSMSAHAGMARHHVPRGLAACPRRRACSVTTRCADRQRSTWHDTRYLGSHARRRKASSHHALGCILLGRGLLDAPGRRPVAHSQRNTNRFERHAPCGSRARVRGLVRGPEQPGARDCLVQHGQQHGMVARRPAWS